MIIQAFLKIQMPNEKPVYNFHFDSILGRKRHI